LFVTKDHPDAVLPEWYPQTKGKYMKEARALWGVMMKRSGGTKTGHTMKPFNYTARKVIGPAAWEKAKLLEMQRPKTMKSYINAKGKGGVWNVKDKEHGKTNPYRARYGDDHWEEKVNEQVNKTLCNVTDLIDHAIDQGNLMFADTKYKDNWVLWHDALSSWWSAAAQEHMKKRGFYNRQVKIMGRANCAAVKKRYADCLVGDSPEFSPLDNNIFADLMRHIKINIALTFMMDRKDPRKFSRASPELAYDCMVRSWTRIESHRIVEDIEKLPRAFRAVVKAEGIKVEFSGARHGRRHNSHHQDKTRSKAKSVAKDSVPTLDQMNLHPDALAGLELMKETFCPDHAVKFFDAVEEYGEFMDPLMM
jgi:hypothetical protein